MIATVEARTGSRGITMPRPASAPAISRTAITAATVATTAKTWRTRNRLSRMVAPSPSPMPTAEVRLRPARPEALARVNSARLGRCSWSGR